MSEFSYRGKLPFRIVSSSVNTGYNAELTAAVAQNIEIVNQHRDEYGELQDSPAQGPFTEQWVGGNQHRHIPLNQPRLKEELVLVPTPPVSASYTFIGFTPGNEITFTAVAAGSAGNNIFISLENLSSESIGVVTVGTDIFVTIYVGGDGGGFNNSVESLMNDPLNWPDSNQLLTVATIGSFEFGPFGPEQLTGGSDGGFALVPQMVVKLDDITDRPEAFLLGGTPNKVRVYGPTHFDINAPKALLTRDNVSKSSVNIKNIRNESRRLGNFSHNYEVVQTSGRNINQSLIENNLTASGVLTTKFIKDVEEYSLPQEPNNKTVFVERFNAPGGKEESSRGALDRESEQYSPNNSLVTRNIKVRQPFYGQLTQHAAQFNSGSTEGVTIHAVNRNSIQTIELSGTTFLTASDHDNFWIQHSIPSTDLRYKWIKDSVVNSTTVIQYQDPYDSSQLIFNTGSLVKNGSNNQFEVNNSFINSIVKDKKSINLITNTFTISQPRLSASFSEITNTPFGFSTWKEIRNSEHPVTKNLRKNNIISVQTPEIPIVNGTRTTRKRSNSVTNFTEPPVTVKFKPLVHALKFKEKDKTFYFVSTYGNNRSTVVTPQLKDILNVNENTTQIGNMLTTYYTALDRTTNPQNPIEKLQKLNYSETLYPREINTYLAETRARTQYILDQPGTGSDGYDKQLGTQRVFWRDNLEDRLREGGFLGEDTFYNSQNYPAIVPDYFEFPPAAFPAFYESPFQRNYYTFKFPAFNPPDAGKYFASSVAKFKDSVLALDNLPDYTSTVYGTFSASFKGDFDAIDSSNTTSIQQKEMLIKARLTDNGLSGELNKELFLDYFYSSSIPNSGVLDGDSYYIDVNSPGTTRQLTRVSTYSTLYQYIPEMTSSEYPYDHANPPPFYSRKFQSLPTPKISYTAFLGGFETGNRNNLFLNNMENIYNSQPSVTPIPAFIRRTSGFYLETSFIFLEAGTAGNSYKLTLQAAASNSVQVNNTSLVITINVVPGPFGIQPNSVVSVVNNDSNWSQPRLIYAFTTVPFGSMSTFTEIPFAGGSDGTIYTTLDSGLRNAIEEMSGKKPWFDSYEKYSEDIRAHGKEYSIVPEFKISSHIPYYIKEKGGNFRAENRAFLEIDGTNPSRSANAESTRLIDISLPQFLNHRTSGYNQKFIDSYVSTEPLEYISNFDNQSTNTHLSQIRFTISGIKKLLPYNGFYPKDRTVQLAALFSEFLEENVKGGYYTYYSGSNPIISSSALVIAPPLNRFITYNITNEQNIWSKNVVLPYFFAPGILYNTIKSGISVDFPKIVANKKKTSYINPHDSVELVIHDQYTKEVSILESLKQQVDAYNDFYKDNLDMYASVLENGSIVSRMSFESLIFPEQEIPLFQRTPASSVTVLNEQFFNDELITENFYKEYISGSLLSIKFDANRIADHHTQILYQDSGIKNLISDYFINIGKVNHLTVPFAFRTTDVIKNPSYSLAMSNFLAEIPRFFLKDQKMNSFTSADLQDWDQFELDKKYYFDLKMKKSNNLVMIESYNSDKHISGTNDLEKTFNGRYFGWPTSKVSGTHSAEQKYVVHNDPAYAPFTPPYFEGEAILRFELTPTSASYANMRSLYKDIKLINIYNDLGRIVQTGSEAFNNKMPIQSCVDVFGIGFNKQVVYDTLGNPIQISDVNNDLFSTGKQFWSISPKLETPVLDFSEQPLLPQTGSYWSTSGYGRGMWSGYGKIPTGSQGITLELAESFPQKTDFLKDRTLQVNSQFEELGSFELPSQRTGSLLQIAKFKSEVKKIGNLAETKEISEAIVMIPYVDRTLENITTYIDGHNFFSIKSDIFNKQKTNIAAGRSPIMKDDLGSDVEIRETSISKMIDCMKRYVIPPNFDFMTYNNINPFVMFIFEFKHILDKEDLADIWQGVMPKIALSAQEDKVVFTQNIGEYELFGKDFKIPENMRWMIFKVKKKAEWNYFAVTENQADDQRFTFNFANSEVAKTPDYSYNWPYDYFSLVELAKVDITLSYEENLSGSVPLQQSITLITNT